MPVPLIIILSLTLGVVLLGGSLYASIIGKLRQISRYAFGTSNILKGFQNMEKDVQQTPLSVSGGTGIYLSRILKDFPDFHRQALEEKVKQFMTQYYNCLEKGSIKELRQTDITYAVSDAIRSEIDDLEDNLNIDQIKFHKIAIFNYEKSEELATVRYQISSEYFDGTRTHQLKHEVDVSYLFRDMDQKSFALQCANCGAPLKRENRTCEYCGVPVVRNIERVWRISHYKELNHI
jgi:rRNA maturation endonuclease Nob1